MYFLCSANEIANVPGHELYKATKLAETDLTFRKDYWVMFANNNK